MPGSPIACHVVEEQLSAYEVIEASRGVEMCDVPEGRGELRSGSDAARGQGSATTPLWIKQAFQVWSPLVGKCEYEDPADTARAARWGGSCEEAGEEADGRGRWWTAKSCFSSRGRCLDFEELARQQGQPIMLLRGCKLQAGSCWLGQV